MKSSYTNRLPDKVLTILETRQARLDSCQNYLDNMAALWLLVDGMQKQGVDLVKMADSEETVLKIRQDDTGWSATEALNAAIGGDEAFTMHFKDRESGLIEKLWIIIGNMPYEIVADGSSTCERISWLSTEIMNELEPELSPEAVSNIQVHGM